MKKERLLVMIGSISLLLILLVSSFVLACAKPAQTPPPAPGPAPAPAPAPAPTTAPAPKPTPIVLNAVQFLDLGTGTIAGFEKMFIPWVNERSKGELTIKLTGPAAIAPMEQTEAVRSGAVDMAAVPTAYYAPLLPEGAAYQLSQISPSEERKNGFHDLMVKLHQEKAGVYLLGRNSFDAEFHLFTTKEVKNPRSNFIGLRLRTAALYDKFMKEIGITPVTMKQADIYSAAERGVVDGAGATVMVIKQYSLWEVMKYINGPSFYGQNITTLINLKKWNALPKHLQDLLIQCQLELESKGVASYDEEYAKTYALLLDKGMKHTRWSAADEQWYRDLAYRVAWEEVRSQIASALYDQLRDLTTKK